jgi:uncharacterized protein involved in exopolysaccharide biosynthesis
MADSERLRSLREQRAALALQVEDSRKELLADLVVPILERALNALDDLIARESQEPED